ncbi:hypothetical protein FA95DRAFT_1676868 [Auriscalpium vulgare]|uniref:Uncharacterized protein n=1 Tax=Auriscalpium vulgare TaxID=40419 RepID=A0ACB8S2L8_9AGAM|nr:hypothetical protein FA95DRAFT_1676868 [Auriscalpium vulgare]
MRVLSSSFFVLAALSSVARGALNVYAFGSDFSIGAYSSSPAFNITHVTTTFTPGAAPSTQDGELYLWPGLMSIKDEFLYANVQQSSPSACSGSASQWCLTAQYVGAGGLISGSYSALTGSEPVTLDFSLNPDSTWTTSASISGKVVSTLQRTISRVSIFGIANECFSSGCSAASAAQTYTDTTITLSSATPSFGASATSGLGTTFTTPTTSDAGQTWTIAQITVPQAGTQFNA